MQYGVIGSCCQWIVVQEICFGFFFVDGAGTREIVKMSSGTQGQESARSLSAKLFAI